MYQNFLSKNYLLWMEKFSVYLNRLVFVMVKADLGLTCPSHSGSLIWTVTVRLQNHWILCIISMYNKGWERNWVKISGLDSLGVCIRTVICQTLGHLLSEDFQNQKISYEVQLI